MAESTVTSKGQITIPKVVRERLQLETGDKVYFDVRDDGSVIMVARNEPLEGLFGMLKSSRRRALTIDEMNPGSLADAE
ncbi:MAG TPA: AbrB/MazE/SpoVT family DNA-binding domain-containing protein [Gemmatimonadaceae bacterium]|nr:AbrB/MazE/SpoVT family DNA-binding domain-containing protein [Gemmatimonadaceae bacterium]